MNPLPWNDYGAWLRRRLGCKAQKISVDAGLSCPNRDGTLGTSGCAYCDNRAFRPAYCEGGNGVARQLEEGKTFFARKYPDMKFLAYFQAYTNTHAPLERLKRLYGEALEVDGVAGLVVATRPDCLPNDVLDHLGSLAHQTFLTLELGVETANDATLRLIGRGHDFGCSRRAIERAKERGITVGAHIIIGLPGEDEAESLRQASIVSELPIDILKLHQLQIIRGTRLERMYAERPFHLYSADEYIGLASAYLQLIRKDIVVERLTAQAPSEMVVAPRWGLKNHEFAHRLAAFMRSEGLTQGQLRGN